MSGARYFRVSEDRNSTVLLYIKNFDHLYLKKKSIINQLLSLSKYESVDFQVFDGTDACVTPVLSQEEAPSHPQNLAR